MTTPVPERGPSAAAARMRPLAVRRDLDALARELAEMTRSREVSWYDSEHLWTLQPVLDLLRPDDTARLIRLLADSAAEQAYEPVRDLFAWLAAGIPDDLLPAVCDDWLAIAAAGHDRQRVGVVPVGTSSADSDAGKAAARPGLPLNDMWVRGLLPHPWHPARHLEPQGLRGLRPVPRLAHPRPGVAGTRRSREVPGLGIRRPPGNGRGSGGTRMRIAGRWRITQADLWDCDALNLVAPALIEFAEAGSGHFGFIAVQGGMDCREIERDGRPGVEFSWEGNDECDPVSGRGWAVLERDGSLRGRIFFHLGDDSGFTAVRETNEGR